MTPDRPSPASTPRATDAVNASTNNTGASVPPHPASRSPAKRVERDTTPPARDAKLKTRAPVGVFERLVRSKIVVWLLLILPGLWPAWPLFVTQDPSALADGLKFILLHLGFTASVLLAVVLTFTPLRVLWPKVGVVQALNRHRRLVGVSAFAYGALHFATHLFYEIQGGVAGPLSVLKTDVTKPFLLTGILALTILLVLTITSVNAAIRWLGGKTWKNLHRLAYVAAALIAYHQSAARKVFPVQVLWIFVPLALLELARVVKQRRTRAV